MIYRALLLLALATAHAWNDCAFPDVGYFVAEEGIGYSSGYAGAAMNGKMYMGGHTKGHFALLGITDDGVVTPEPSATLWGDVGSDVQVRLASPSTVPLSQHSPPQSTEPLRRGGGFDYGVGWHEDCRQNDEELVVAGLGAPSGTNWARGADQLHQLEPRDEGDAG